MSRRDGFSLLELLIVVAIIGILMSLALVSLNKAYRKAKGVVASEGMRQDAMGRMADNANSASHLSEPATREQCRAAFREEVAEGLYATRPLYIVRDDSEFEAYYDTLVDPRAEGELRTERGMVIAEDRSGRKHYLLPIGPAAPGMSDAVVGWEYLSMSMADMNGTGIGGKVVWGDGHIEFVHYPGGFPMTETVATIGRRYVLEQQRAE